MSQPPHSFWRIALAVVSQLWRWFGSPSRIAEVKVFDRREYDLLTRFLRGAEAMLRAGLLLQAAELCLAGDLPAPQRRARPSGAKRQTQGISFRVFDLLSGARRNGGAIERRQLWEPTRYFDAAPLARRAEAVLRVVQNPAPYVGRLARKLKACPRLARRINTNYASHDLIIPKSLWIDTCDSVREAADALLAAANTS